jgi:hypothetical protein
MAAGTREFRHPPTGLAPIDSPVVPPKLASQVKVTTTMIQALLLKPGYT